MAEMLHRSNIAVTTSLSQVMSAAWQLPLGDQVELAEALIGKFRVTLRGDQPEENIKAEPRPLRGMEEAELHVLADAVLATDRQEELSELLRKNRKDELTKGDEKRLDALLAKVDRLALLKAKALYTLQLRQAVKEAQ